LPEKITVRDDALVAGHHLQDVEQLALVLVEALGVDVEQAVDVDFDAQVAPQALSQSELVGPLGGRELRV
jgi:hypothetical protein